MNFQGRSAIVTGAGRGIGRDIALLLAAMGAKVVVCDTGAGRGGEEVGERPADDVVREIEVAGGTAFAAYDSIADHRAAGAIVQACVKKFGSVDILVNSAGVLRERMIWNMSEEEWDTVINVHLKGYWNMCHHAIRHMRQAGFGRIVNFSSEAFKGSLGQCNYAAAKAGIIGLTRSIAKEAAKFGITANAVCPIADTRMTDNPAVKANFKRKLEQGLMSQAEYDKTMQPRGPEHIAPAVAFLCHEDTDYVNGEILHVERGMLHTYYYGEEKRALYRPDGEVFTAEELARVVPSTLFNGVQPVVPIVKRADAEKAVARER